MMASTRGAKVLIAGQRQPPTCWVTVRKASTTSDEYIHRSTVPTYHFQPSLPRLPIPKLEKTCSRYLDAQRPLLDDADYHLTTKITNEFLKGPGLELHNALVRKDSKNKQTSYISEPWFDMYLRDRSPVVLNHTPLMAFNDDPDKGKMKQAVRATNMIVSAMRFMKTLRAELLEPEVYHLNPQKSDTKAFRRFVKYLPSRLSWYGAFMYKAFPLDMSQYSSLFNSTRVPAPGKDILTRDMSARQLLVLRNGHLFSFDVINEDGSIVSPEEVLAHIEYILEAGKTPAQYSPAVFTTQERDYWANVREKLVLLGNSSQLKEIDTAVFALSLDDEAHNDPTTLVRSMLHGDGTNRWFDKSFNVIVQSDGRAAMNFEHSWGDGVAVLRFMNEVYSETIQRAHVHADTAPARLDSSQAVRKIELTMDDEIKAEVTNSLERLRKTTASLGVHVFQNPTIGKRKIKEWRVSPDAVMQLAFQMAFLRQTGRTVATYESCSTAAYRHGRTETVRPATVYTKAASMAFLQGTDNKAELRAMVAKCSKVHQQLIKEAAMGQGFDRHLFALRKLAEADGEVPAFFQDTAYTLINRNILSTSTLSTDSVMIGKSVFLTSYPRLEGSGR